MSRKVSMPVLWGALGCAAALALLAGHGLAQQNATFNSYRIDDGWLNVPDGRRMGLATKITLDRDGKSLWVFDRCGAVDCVGSMLDPIAKFDPLGNLMVRFGGPARSGIQSVGMLEGRAARRQNLRDAPKGAVGTPPNSGCGACGMAGQDRHRGRRGGRLRGGRETASRAIRG